MTNLTWIAQGYEIKVTMLGDDREAYVDIFQVLKKIIVPEIKPESDYIELIHDANWFDDNDFDYLCGEIKHYKKPVETQYDPITGGEIQDQIIEPLSRGNVKFLIAIKKDNRIEQNQTMYAVFAKKGYYSIDRAFEYLAKKVMASYPIANLRLSQPIVIVNTDILEFFKSLYSISKIDVVDIRLPNPRAISDYMKSLITLNVPERILFEGHTLKKEGPIIIDLIQMSYDDKYGILIEIIGESESQRMVYLRDRIAQFEILISDKESNKQVFEKLKPIVKKVITKISGN
jgi:hypothetical protein